MKPILAWHFVGDTLRDGRPVPEESYAHLNPLVVSLFVFGVFAALIALSIFLQDQRN